MARVKIPRPQAELKLRKWPAGRVSQLKLFLGHLQQVIGVSLAAQVEQSPKRKFSAFVPKIVPQDVTVDVEYREIRIFFEPPKGQKNLLFYEYDISATAGFFNVDRFASPEPVYVYAGLDDGLTFYLRIRVVTKNGEVGPWSDTESATTPLAQAFGIRDGTEFQTRVTNNAFYPWQTVWERTYTAIGGKTYYAVDYDVSVFRKYGLGGSVEWTDVEFKWMDKSTASSNFVQTGRTFDITAYASNGTFSQSAFYEFSVTTNNFYTPLVIPGDWTNPRRGTFVQKFQEIKTGAHTFRLEARVRADHTDPVFKNDFVTSPGTSIVYGSDANVLIKNFNIFEVLVE